MGYFYFNCDAFDIAFVFTIMELSRLGAILQGIDNLFVCRYYDDEEEVNDGQIVPFPLMMKQNIPPCFLASFFLDIETLRSQISANLNPRAEQQGELMKTFNHISFAWESWAYLRFKLLDRLAIPVLPLTNCSFLHCLTHDMKRTKFAVLNDTDIMQFSSKVHLITLRSVLGSIICYGIGASGAKLSNRDPCQIPPGCAINCVVAADEANNADTAKFVQVPPAYEGGFDLIHNGNNVLSLRSRYRKFHFETKDGKSTPLKNSSLPQHFQDILKPQNWGFWSTSTVSVKKAFFDHDKHLYVVTSVFDDRIKAKPLFMDSLTITFHDTVYVMEAIARKEGLQSS
jgi:hypothetical protein